MLTLHRTKVVLTRLFAVTFVFLLPNWVAASPAGISYRISLGHDLDGDHIPETATIRQCGHIFQVNIHFTTGRPKLRLTTYLSEGVAGLTFEATDVNNDNKDDLVLVSATSFTPIAVWLNQGKT